MNTSTIILNVLGMVILTIVVAGAMIGVPLLCDRIPGAAAPRRAGPHRPNSPRRETARVANRGGRQSSAQT